MFLESGKARNRFKTCRGDGNGQDGRVVGVEGTKTQEKRRLETTQGEGASMTGKRPREGASARKPSGFILRG